jgi:hypothetical protein
MQLKLSRYVLEIPIPAYISEPASDRLLFCSRTGKIVRVSRHYLNMVNSGDFAGLPDKLFYLLCDHEILVPADEVEEWTLVHRQRLEAEDSNECSAVFFVREKDFPMAGFWDDLMSRIQERLNGVPANDIKKRIYHIRFWVIMEQAVAEPACLSLLDQRLRECKTGLNVAFSFCVLYQDPGPEHADIKAEIKADVDKAGIPALKLLESDMLVFVFREKKGFQYETARLDPIRHLLVSSERYSRIKVQIVFEWIDKCWANWTDSFIRALVVLSRDRRVSLEFVRAGCTNDYDHLEKALMNFLREQGVRCKWLPRLQRLLVCALNREREEGMGFLADEPVTRVLNTDQYWDGDEVLHLPELEMMSAACYRESFLLQPGFSANIRERVLITAGIPLFAF